MKILILGAIGYYLYQKSKSTTTEANEAGLAQGLDADDQLENSKNNSGLPSDGNLPVCNCIFYPCSCTPGVDLVSDDLTDHIVPII